MGMAFGNYALCDAEFSCFPPLFDDIVAQTGLPDKYVGWMDGRMDGSLFL